LFIAGALGTAHASPITLIVQDLRLVEDVMNVMAGQPDGATYEEMRHQLNLDGGTPGGAPPPPPPRRPPPPPWGAPPPRQPRPGGAPRPAGVPHARQAPPSSPGSAPPWGCAPSRHHRASSHYLPPAYDSSYNDCDDSQNACPPVCRRLYGGPGGTSQTGGSCSTGGGGGVVRQGNLIGGMGSRMGDGSGSEKGGTRGAQGDHDTRHVGTGGGWLQ